MATEYLFRRTSTARAPWQFQFGVMPTDEAPSEPPAARGNVAFPIRVWPRRDVPPVLISTVPPADVAEAMPFGVTFVSAPLQYIRVTTRDAAYRFFSIKSGGDDVTTEEQFTRTILPSIAPAPRRASNAAYSITATVPPLDLPPVPSSISIGVPVLVRRAANSSYWIDNRLATPEPLGFEEYPGRRLLPETAPGARRAAGSAYVVTVTVPPADVQFEESSPRRLLPDTAPVARRAANSAYFVAAVVPPPSIDQEELPWKRLLPDTAPAPRRAASQAYLVTANVPPPSVEFEELPRLLLPERAPGPRRAAQTAYVVNLPVPPPDEPQATSVQAVTQFARGPLRAANQAYWVHAEYPVPDMAPQVPPFKLDLSQPRFDRRAAASAYWVTNLLVVPEIVVPIIVPPGPEPIPLEPVFQILVCPDQLTPIQARDPLVVSPLETRRPPGTTTRKC